MNKLRLAALTTSMGLLAACAAPPITSIQAPVAAPAFESKSYAVAAASGIPVYEIDSSASNVWILVDVAGPMARLGHQHAVTSPDLEGHVVMSQAQSHADLRLSLRALQVDQPEARRYLKLEGDLSDEAVSGTREHMLESLQADQFPDLLVQIHELRSSGDSVTAIGILYLHGVIKSIEVPVDISHSEAELRISGTLQVRQTDFGIKPYSALNGGLQVADELTVSFSLAARRFEAE